MLKELLVGRGLTEPAARRIFDFLFKSQLSSDEAKSVLLLLAAKGESAEELNGCLSALRKLEPPLAVKIPALIDTCGTGGDGSGTVNVSTLAALVIAGAGGRVAKHGNRAISSRAGSSDLLEALGVQLDAGPDTMIRSIRENGIGYFHAPLYHPVFARMQPLRKQLGVRTIFNMLGPLVNPLKVAGQVVGVSRKEHMPLFAAVLAKRRLSRALVCHSRDGLDEISVSAKTDVVWVENGRIRSGVIDPAVFGIRKVRAHAYRGGGLKKNASIALKLLAGRLGGPVKDIVALNAAAGLWVAEIVSDMAAGVVKAKETLANGKALAALEGLKKMSRSGKRE